MPLTLLDHPLAAHLVAELRDEATPPDRFRFAARRLTTLLVIEATRDMAQRPSSVRTPVGEANCQMLAQGLTVVPILRAGLGMLESAVELFTDVSVGYIGLERHERTAVAHSYYCKLPRLEGRYVLCLDPMLATGGSASQALSLISAAAAVETTMVCVVAAPEGVARLEQDHPKIRIVAAALDQQLDAQKFIVPGLGDFGDRLYGTD
jgi:uracil phosphoribosyltransferase